MVRHGLPPVCLAAMLALATSMHATPGDGTRRHETVTASDRDGHSGTYQLSIQARSDAARDRMRHVAQIAIARFTRWFGLLANRQITLIEPSLAPVRLHHSVELEQHVVTDVTRRWWGDAIRLERTADAAFARGIESYVSGFILEQIYAARFGIAGRAADTAEYFGSQLLWTFPGLALDRRVVAGHTPAARAERMLLTLEGLLGSTAMERALHVVALDSRDQTLTRAGFVAALGVAAGRDLAWFLPAVDVGRLDYAVQTVAEHSLTVARLEEGVFPGTNRSPLGSYDAGRAVEIEVRFSDGQSILERWDGRDRSRVYEYESPGHIIAAIVDPRGVLVLDDNRLNNVTRIGGEHPVRVVPWMARWSAWLQNALLTASLVL